MLRLALTVPSFGLLLYATSALCAPLANPGFEDADATSDWTRHVYGANPVIELSPDSHEGRRSLRIACDAPTDTALGQEIILTPGSWYRLTGWVKTQGLDPMGAPVFGTYQVQTPGGRSVLATGENHQGDTDWTPVRIVFEAPPDGRARIAVFFVGYGKGKGSAWFDDVTLEPIEMKNAPIRVTRTPICDGEITALQCGQFIEYLCDLVPAMWSERLYDGSFEGLTPYSVVFRKETDFQEKPWFPTGAVNRAEYAHDTETKVHGDNSMRIRVAEGAPAVVGISQSGVFVDKGKDVTFRCALKQEGVKGPVRVRIHSEGRTFCSAELTPSADWDRISVRMSPNGRCEDATLSIEFRGPGTLWLDTVSLMPVDNVNGWRPDVVKALKDLKPGCIRTGGSAIEYSDWRDIIGPVEQRKPYRAWGGRQPVEPGLEEVIRLIQSVGAEPVICTRFTDRTPKDSADQVEYFNGSVDTPMGALRARNGHPEPYRIKYWQPGNETWGEEYWEKLASHCEAMRKVDPTIELISAGPSETLLEKSGRAIDYIAPHYYNCVDLAGTQNDIDHWRQQIKALVPGRQIRMAVTEWNTTAADWGLGRAKLWTLENALAVARFHNLMHRNADMVVISNRSNLTNSFCSGIIQTNNHALYKTPAWYAQYLYANLQGTTPLKTESDAPAAMLPDVSATLSEDGRTLTLFCVNDSLSVRKRTLDLGAFGKTGQTLSVWTLADRDGAGEPDATNEFGDPERIAVKTSKLKVESPAFEYAFPPLSVTALRWKVQR
jgi:alpha-N-arabinofuranosidase